MSWPSEGGGGLLPSLSNMTEWLEAYGFPKVENIMENMGVDRLMDAVPDGAVNALAGALPFALPGPLGLAAGALLRAGLGDVLNDILTGIFADDNTSRPDAPDGTHWGTYPFFMGPNGPQGIPDDYPSDLDPEYAPLWFMWHMNMTAPPFKVDSIEPFGKLKNLQGDSVLLTDDGNIPIGYYQDVDQENGHKNAQGLIVGFTQEGWAIPETHWAPGGDRNTTFPENYPESYWTGRKTVDYDRAYELLTSKGRCKGKLSGTDADELISMAQEVRNRQRMATGIRVAAAGTGLGITGGLIWMGVRKWLAG